MSDRRRFAAMIVLFLIGLGMVAMADAFNAYWPLFLTPFPYAAIPWMIARTALPTPMGGEAGPE